MHRQECHYDCQIPDCGCAGDCTHHCLEVVVALSTGGTAKGTVYHTWKDHGKGSPHHVPIFPADVTWDEIREGETTDYEERPSWAYTTVEQAQFFGLKECDVCKRSRFLQEEVPHNMLYVREINEDSVRIVVRGRRLTLRVGQGIPLDLDEITQGDMVSMPQPLREFLGMEDGS